MQEPRSHSYSYSRRTVNGPGCDFHSLEEFHKHDEVKHNGGSEEGILASVVNDQSVETAHGDGRSVFIHGTFAVADVGNVFDDDKVVRLRSPNAGAKQFLVGPNYVVCISKFK